MEGNEYFGILSATIQDWPFWTGFGTIALYSLSRFNEKYHGEEEVDPPLPNRCFTTRFRFYSTWLVYCLFFLIAYSLLIVFGSIPRFQDLLKELVGSVAQHGGGSETIGSPAWAAMVVMVVAPALKPVHLVDFNLRRWLLRFASIPMKVRSLADELVMCYASSANPAEAGDDVWQLSDESLWAADAALEALKQQLKSDHNPKADRYRAFFNEHDGVVTGIEQKAQILKARRDDVVALPAAEAESGVATSMLHEQLAAQVMRHARFLCCAVLNVEAGEYEAREHLRKAGDCDTLPPAPFRFRVHQAFLTSLVAFVACTLAGTIVHFVFGGPPQSLVEVVDKLAGWALWGAVTGVALMFTAILAAAVQFWLLDEERFHKGRQRSFGVKSTTTVCTLIGCAFLAALPLFVGELIDARIESRDVSALILLYGLVPAVATLAFIKLSRRPAILEGLMGALVDFVLIGSVGAVAVTVVHPVVVALKAVSTGEEVLLNQWLANSLESLPELAVVAFVVTGVFGAMHCRASRPYLGTAAPYAVEPLAESAERRPDDDLRPAAE